MRHHQGSRLVLGLLLGGGSLLVWLHHATHPWLQGNNDDVDESIVRQHQHAEANAIITKPPLNNETTLSLNESKKQLSKNENKSSHAEVSDDTEVHYYYLAKQFSGGRLGNQLYEWLSTLGLAKALFQQTNRLFLACEIPNYRKKYQTEALQETFAVNVPPCPSELEYAHEWIEEGFGVYKGQDWLSNATNDGNIAIRKSYLQSFRYLDLLPATFFTANLTFTESTQQQAAQVWSNLTTILSNMSHHSSIFVGIHVRRTDMLQFAHGAVRTPRLAYYQKATARLQRRYRNKNVVFVVASDDAEWCRNESSHFFKPQQPQSPIVILPRVYHPGIHMAVLVQYMNGGMILSAGSFGWWISYLAQQVHGSSSLDYPVVYFDESFRLEGTPYQGQVHKEDFYPKDWIGLPDYDLN